MMPGPAAAFGLALLVSLGLRLGWLIGDMLEYGIDLLVRPAQEDDDGE